MERSLKVTLVMTVLAAMLALESNSAHAQNWRRNGRRLFQPPQPRRYTEPSASSDQYRPGRPVPRTDPSASSDLYRPNRPVPRVDPSASSDLYRPQWQPQYPQGYIDPSASSDPFYPDYPPPAPRLSLGVQYQPARRGGAYVTYVEPYSPAFRVGIEPGDIILSVDGIDATNLGRAIRLSDGFVEAIIIDVRTGRRIQRNIDLNQ